METKYAVEWILSHGGIVVENIRPAKREEVDNIVMSPELPDLYLGNFDPKDYHPDDERTIRGVQLFNSEEDAREFERLLTLSAEFSLEAATKYIQVAKSTTFTVTERICPYRVYLMAYPDPKVGLECFDVRDGFDLNHGFINPPDEVDITAPGFVPEDNLTDSDCFQIEVVQVFPSRESAYKFADLLGGIV